MSIELPNPTERNVTDVRYPISVDPKSEWAPITEALAEDITTTSDLLLGAIDKSLPDNYRVHVEIEEPDSFLNATIVNDLNDLNDINALLNKAGPKLETWVGLMPEEGTEHEKPVIILVDDGESLQLSVWGETKQVKLRGRDFQVRHRQHWRLWNYHAAKKKQGYSEEDFPGNLWQPEYKEEFVIVDSEYEGQDLVELLRQFDESIKELIHTNGEASEKKSAWDQVVEKVERQDHRTIRSNVLCEVSEATGITPHECAGIHALEEARKVLAAIRSFV